MPVLYRLKNQQLIHYTLCNTIKNIILQKHLLIILTNKNQIFFRILHLNIFKNHSKILKKQIFTIFLFKKYYIHLHHTIKKYEVRHKHAN